MQLGLLDVLSVVITPMTWIHALEIAVSGPAPPSGSWEVACHIQYKWQSKYDRSITSKENVLRFYMLHGLCLQIPFDNWDTKKALKWLLVPED